MPLIITYQIYQHPFHRVSTDTIAGKIAIPVAFSPLNVVISAASLKLDPDLKDGNPYCYDQVLNFLTI